MRQQKDKIKNNNFLNLLFIIHGTVTIAAGFVLIFFPAAIPKTVGIDLSKNEYLLSYLLGAAEFGIGFLSLAANSIKDQPALRVIVITFIIFHGATGILEIYASTQGISSKIIFNVILRVIIVALFTYFGIYKTRKH